MNSTGGGSIAAGDITLYNYFRSSASYRVRIALELKGLKYDYVPIHLTRSGGEQFASSYAEVNPEMLVPTFVDAGGSVITQSLAIIEYVDETHPDPALLPQTPVDRAYVRSIANLIACDIHPVDNLRVLGYLKNVLNVTDEQKSAWYRHWVEEGFKALETHLVRESRLGGRAGTLCFGDKRPSPTCASSRRSSMPDVCRCLWTTTRPSCEWPRRPAQYPHSSAHRPAGRLIVNNSRLASLTGIEQIRSWRGI